MEARRPGMGHSVPLVANPTRDEPSLPAVASR
jgi:hypothetical protein